MERAKFNILTYHLAHGHLSRQQFIVLYIILSTKIIYTLNHPKANTAHFCRQSANHRWMLSWLTSFFYLKYNGGTIIVNSYHYYSFYYHYLFLNQDFKNANSQEKCPNIWIIDLRFSNSIKNVFITQPIYFIFKFLFLKFPVQNVKNYVIFSSYMKFIFFFMNMIIKKKRTSVKVGFIHCN